MGITLPQTYVSADYPELLVSAMNVIDAHNHSYNPQSNPTDTGKGLTEKSIDWTDFIVNGGILYNLSSLFLVPYITTGPVVTSPCLFFLQDSLGIDLFWFDGTTNIRITLGGAYGALQTVSGFYGDAALYDARVSYDANSTIYSFNLGRDLANISANSVNVTSILIGNSFYANIATPLVITSTGFFYDMDSILCGEGTDLCKIKFQSTNITKPIDVSPNPRLLSTTDRFRNNQTIPDVLFRQTRYNYTSYPVPVNPESFLGTCEIRVIKGTLPSPTFFNNTIDFHIPPQEVAAQNTRDHFYNAGACPDVTPIFDVNGLGTIELYVTYQPDQSFDNPQMGNANKVFSHSVVVTDPGINPSITFFQEFQAHDPNANLGLQNLQAFSAFYQVSVIDLNTNLPYTNFSFRLRI